MTARDASQRVLTVLFGMKVPGRRSCVRIERPVPPKPESKWAERSQAECLRKIGEVCERNKAKAPRPAPHFMERVPGSDDDREEEAGA